MYKFIQKLHIVIPGGWWEMIVEWGSCHALVLVQHVWGSRCRSPARGLSVQHCAKPARPKLTFLCLPFTFHSIHSPTRPTAHPRSILCRGQRFKAFNLSCCFFTPGPADFYTFVHPPTFTMATPGASVHGPHWNHLPGLANELKMRMMMIHAPGGFDYNGMDAIKAVADGDILEMVGSTFIVQSSHS